jgi:hypothetical protein
MQKLYIKQTSTTPEINFSPDENIFIISGTSSPEDVRAMYYPVIEWTKIFVDDVLEEEHNPFKAGIPFDLKIDLTYFNSSSAKFFYDILMEIQRLIKAEIPVKITWYYDEEDSDMREAGVDISLLLEMEFIYVSKSKKR